VTSLTVSLDLIIDCSNTYHNHL